ncbi:MAG: GTPase Era, partial [Candidatus Puniceispirillaceae bacterium]
MTQDTKAGFVALLGAPNAGKSTLMNAMVGQKISIVTPKVQTTRSRVRGIVMHENSQIIFVDTPGIFKPKRRLDRAMVSAAWQGADDADLLLLLHDCARKKVDDDTLAIMASLKELARPVTLVLNKIDLVSPEQLLERTKELSEMMDFSRVFMVSADKDKGLDDLLVYLADEMMSGPYLFDPDDLSDLPMRLMAAEVMREKLFLNLHQELPYQL